MQLMPDTAREMGVTNVYDPKANIKAESADFKADDVRFNDRPPSPRRHKPYNGQAVRC